MARPVRIEYEGACVHVMDRGNGPQRIFHRGDDYGLFHGSPRGRARFSGCRCGPSAARPTSSPCTSPRPRRTSRGSRPAPERGAVGADPSRRATWACAGVAKQNMEPRR